MKRRKRTLRRGGRRGAAEDAKAPLIPGNMYFLMALRADIPFSATVRESLRVLCVEVFFFLSALSWRERHGLRQNCRNYERAPAPAIDARPMMPEHSPAAAHARSDRPADPVSDLRRHGGRADRLAARRPHRHRAACRHYAVGGGRDDARRFRQLGRHADIGAAVRDDDHLGPVCRIGLYRPVRPHDHRAPRRPVCAAGADHRDRRRDGGSAGQRHPNRRDRAAVDRRGAAPRPRPAAVCAGTGGSHQCRFGRDADRQPAEHPAGGDRPARLLEIPRGVRRAGAVRADRRVQRAVAAMAPPHSAAREPGIRRCNCDCRGDRAHPRPQPDDQGRGRPAGIAGLCS